MSQEIFDGVSGFSGFYKSFDGQNVQITFARANSTDAEFGESELDKGFLIRSYRASWQRPVSMDRPLNRTKPVALIGTGNGTLEISGLVGTAAGFKSLLQAKEQCTPLTAFIRGAASFTDCDDNRATSNGTLLLKLTNIIPSAIMISGGSEQQGFQLQSAAATFVFGGLGIEN